jgi:hypothetical protein
MGTDAQCSTSQFEVNIRRTSVPRSANGPESGKLTIALPPYPNRSG